MQDDEDDFRTSDFPSIIIKKDCFKKEDRVFMGDANFCVKDPTFNTFHAFIDCDDVLLRDIVGLLEKARYRRMGTWLVIFTSPWHFSLANFARISWNEYVVLLSDFPLAHEGYVHYTLGKGYGVLRLGAKYGISPAMMYKLSNEPVGFRYCQTCYQSFFQDWKELKKVR